MNSLRLRFYDLEELLNQLINWGWIEEFRNGFYVTQKYLNFSGRVDKTGLWHWTYQLLVEDVVEVPRVGVWP